MTTYRLPPPLPRHLTSEQVDAELAATGELSDAGALAVASWWQAPTGYGYELAVLASSGTILANDLRQSIEATRRDLALALQLGERQVAVRELDALERWRARRILELATTGHRHPYVGEGVDGARRSAEVDRAEADTLDHVCGQVEASFCHRCTAESSAARWDAQAAELAALEDAQEISRG